MLIAERPEDLGRRLAREDAAANALAATRIAAIRGPEARQRLAEAAAIADRMAEIEAGIGRLLINALNQPVTS